MQVAPTDQLAHFDVDDTLIIWDDQCFDGPSDERMVEVVCPYDGKSTWHEPHSRHIAFLKKLKARGYTIVVWSAAGTGWAEAAIKALELEQWVDWVQAKPIKVIDDLKDPHDIIGIPFELSKDKHSL